MSYLLNYSYWKKVFEQAEQTTSTVETAMISWWTNPPKDKADSAKKSLGYWNGQLDLTTIKKTDGLIKGLTLLQSKQTSLNAEIIKQVIDYLTKSKGAGVYITTFNNTHLGSLFGMINTLSAETIDKQILRLSDTLKLGVVDFNKGLATITKELEQNKKVVVAITPEDKASMVAKITERATAHAKANNQTVEKAIEKAISLRVLPVEGTSTTTSVAGQAKEAVRLEFSYPDKAKPEDSLMQNFFGDDISTPTPEQVEKFTTLVKTAIAEVTKGGAKITKVEYFSGGITSKVGTKYLGEGKKDTTWKSENNLILVKDRISKINAVLNKALTDNVPAGTPITKGADESAPNAGPGWYEYSTKNSEGASVYTYGPLYEAARKTNSSSKPKDFYAARTSDSAIKAEYDQVFGKFRGSYGAFLIDSEMIPTEPSNDVEVSASGKWKASISWKYNEPFKFNFKIGASGGGGKSYGGGASPTNCWKN
jgi:hypothetical protein